MKRLPKSEVDTTRVPTRAEIKELMVRARAEAARELKSNKPRPRFAVLAQREYRVGRRGWIRITVGNPRKDRIMGFTCPVQYETSKGQFSCVWLSGVDRLQALESALLIANLRYGHAHQVSGIKLEAGGLTLSGAELDAIDLRKKFENLNTPRD